MLSKIQQQMLVVLLLVASIVQVRAECEDGRGNVVEIHDLLGGRGKVRFLNVSIAVYGADKKPLCSASGPAVQLPGYLKFNSGQVEVAEPLKFQKGDLRIQFTSEHGSFFIGQVCLNGESANAFVPSSMCEADFCEIIEAERCELLTEKQTVDVHALYADYFELPKTPMEIDGEWKVEAGLAIHGEEVARISVGKVGAWIQLETEEKAHEEL